ncbi:oxidoreductase, short chain dehydrogenase/reductase family protein [Lentilactobacillus kisonensis F0435]|nr:oxidoreductase, short chain dehydrogenase/reductase family protein [Lentilactobacillus kisonensis F0435]
MAMNFILEMIIMANRNQLLTLITGADKGIGFETATKLGEAGQHVLLGARNAEKGQRAVDRLRSQGFVVDLVVVDVTDKQGIDQAATKIDDEFGHLDILINNAGIALDNHEKASKLSTAIMRKEFDVNFFGLIDVIQAFLPLLQKAKSAKIINLSSNMGSLGLATDPQSQFYNVNSLGYQASKAAVNFATICFAKELAGTNVTVNSVNPGWTATGFGGRNLNEPTPAGMQTPAEGAEQIVKLATDSKNVMTGTFTESGGTLPW